MSCAQMEGEGSSGLQCQICFRYMRRKSNLQNEGGNYSSAQHWRVTINNMSILREIAVKQMWGKVTV